MTSAVRAIAVALLLVALGPLPAHAIVDTDTPVTGPATAPLLPFPDPALGATGGFPFQAPVGLASPFFVHEGQYSWAPDVADQPGVHLETPGISCKGHVLGQVLPIHPMQATGAAATHIGSALDESAATVGKLDTGGASDFLAAFEFFLDKLASLPGASVPDAQPSATQRACIAYEPLRARWLAAEYAKATPSASFETHFFYPDPRSFGEIRERGARLYCAARAAQFAQGDQVFSMGERVGFSIGALGQSIDFFVTEGTLAFDGPERFTGLGNDGAQAFEVPLLLGTRVTPIRGLPLPGFREVRVPVSLVTADSEVLNGSNLRLIPRPGQVVLQDFSDTHHTVSHWDAIQSAQKSASLGFAEPARILLFTIGPLAVKLGFSVAYGVGALDDPNERVIFLPGVPGARTGRLWVQSGTGRRNHDGAWQPRFSPIGFGLPFPPHWAVRPDGLTVGFWREPITLAGLLSPLPLDIRLLQNDDHTATSATSLTLGGSLTAEAGCCDFPPFTVKLSLTGGVTGTVTQIFHVTDALLAQDQGGVRMRPTTGLGVRSQQTADADLAKTTATLHFALDLPGPFLEDIEFDKTLFEIDKVDLADYDSDDDLAAVKPADDSPNLRLGTGSSAGAVTKKPVVYSHFPGAGGEFQSFATDVDACLADPTPNPLTPAPCDPVPAQGDAPHAELCVYGPSNLLEGLLQVGLPAHVCDGQIGAFVASLALSGEQKQCLQSYLEFLCSGTYHQQPLDGNYSEVVSHLLELGNPAELAAFQAMLETCGEAFGQVNQDGGIVGADGIAEQLLSFGVCDAWANLLEEDEILGAIDPGTPPLTQAPPCH